MAVYQIQEIQRLPVSKAEAWAFFSHPHNLAEITPAHLNLRFSNEQFRDEMYPGQVITYKIRPLLGIPVFWMTEITHVQAGEYFVDEQRVGPYALWHHQHHFREIPGGVEMTDIVHYRIPGWWLGQLANALFVRKQLNNIFTYRRKKVEALFGIYQVRG